jgi:hypothetical protein
MHCLFTSSPCFFPTAPPKPTPLEAEWGFTEAFAAEPVKYLDADFVRRRGARAGEEAGEAEDEAEEAEAADGAPG